MLQEPEHVADDGEFWTDSMRLPRVILETEDIVYGIGQQEDARKAIDEFADHCQCLSSRIAGEGLVLQRTAMAGMKCPPGGNESIARTPADEIHT